MKFIITTGDCDHVGQPPRPSGKTIEVIFGNVWRGPRGDIADAEREAWDAKETPEGAQAKADVAQQAATAAAAEALKAHADDAEIHKTSEQIRADIVEDDIPATIARKTDVEAGDANTLSNAKEYTDDAVAGKADMVAMTEALAGKVEAVAGAGLMSDEEREKLAGIEAGANAYIHPENHSADMITDTDGKVVMTAAEREKLSGIEVAANNYVHPASHYADMIDDTAEKVMMTSAERKKLTGIETGANAYTLPAATAATLGGVKAGNNVTIAEDGTLSATAKPYELSKASSTVLGGIKVGDNLSIREDGTLDAEAGGGTATVSPDAGNALEQRENGLFVPAGSGGSSTESPLLILPYVEPVMDESGMTPTNQQDFINNWGPILSKYIANPGKYILSATVPMAPGMNLDASCQLIAAGEDGGISQYMLAGYAIIPFPDDTGVVGGRIYINVVLGFQSGQLAMVASYIVSPMMDMNSGSMNSLIDTVSEASKQGGSMVYDFVINSAEDLIALPDKLKTMDPNVYRTCLIKKGVYSLTAPIFLGNAYSLTIYAEPGSYLNYTMSGTPNAPLIAFSGTCRALCGLNIKVTGSNVIGMKITLSSGYASICRDCVVDMQYSAKDTTTVANDTIIAFDISGGNVSNIYENLTANVTTLNIPTAKTVKAIGFNTNHGTGLYGSVGSGVRYVNCSAFMSASSPTASSNHEIYGFNIDTIAAAYLNNCKCQLGTTFPGAGFRLRGFGEASFNQHFFLNNCHCDLSPSIYDSISQVDEDTVRGFDARCATLYGCTVALCSNIGTTVEQGKFLVAFLGGLNALCRFRNCEAIVRLSVSKQIGTGFKNCLNVTGCYSDFITPYSSSYASSTTNAENACDDTPAGGWNVSLTRL